MAASVLQYRETNGCLESLRVSLCAMGLIKGEAARVLAASLDPRTFLPHPAPNKMLSTRGSVEREGGIIDEWDEQWDNFPKKAEPRAIQCWRKRLRGGSEMDTPGQQTRTGQGTHFRPR